MTLWAAPKPKKSPIFEAFFENVKVDIDKMAAMSAHGVVGQSRIRQIKADEKLEGVTVYDQRPLGSHAAARSKRPLKQPNVRDSEMPFLLLCSTVVKVPHTSSVFQTCPF